MESRCPLGCPLRCPLGCPLGRPLGRSQHPSKHASTASPCTIQRFFCRSTQSEPAMRMGSHNRAVDTSPASSCTIQRFFCQSEQRSAPIRSACLRPPLLREDEAHQKQRGLPPQKKHLAPRQRTSKMLPHLSLGRENDVPYDVPFAGVSPQPPRFKIRL